MKKQKESSSYFEKRDFDLKKTITFKNKINNSMRELRKKGYGIKTEVPLSCPHCNKSVNLFLEAYRKHLENNPLSCMYCKKAWKFENNKWT